jgi:GT2 family glycosyltransferase
METAAPVTISVVVPTKNRPAEIARMLESLRAQPTMPFEVIVIDQSTPAYALEPFPELVHVHDPSLSGLTAARNRGVDRARGDVVLFFDDDVLLQSDCVAAVAALFAERPDVVGVQCTVHNPWDDEPTSLHDVSTRIFEHGFFNPRPTRRGSDVVPRLIDGLASAYRRSVLERERFDEGGLAGYCLAEDWDFTKRAARYGNLIVAPAAHVKHVHAAANRLDVPRYLELRWKNILYLYDKLEADRDLRNRFWKQWWMLGERLRSLKLALRPRTRL